MLFPLSLSREASSGTKKMLLLPWNVRSLHRGDLPCRNCVNVWSRLETIIGLHQTTVMPPANNDGLCIDDHSSAPHNKGYQLCLALDYCSPQLAQDPDSVNSKFAVVESWCGGSHATPFFSPFPTIFSRTMLLLGRAQTDVLVFDLATMSLLQYALFPDKIISIHVGHRTTPGYTIRASKHVV